MKTRIAIFAAIMTFAVVGQDVADPGQPSGAQVIATTLFSDGSTNVWTQADLVAALQLINRKYHRDCERPDGRRAWHGKMREEIVTNDTTILKREIHEDGQVFEFEAQRSDPAANVAAANSRLKTTMSRGVPAALAAARAQREAEKATTNIVTVTVEAGVR